MEHSRGSSTTGQVLTASFAIENSELYGVYKYNLPGETGSGSPGLVMYKVESGIRTDAVINKDGTLQTLISRNPNAELANQIWWQRMQSISTASKPYGSWGRFPAGLREEWVSYVMQQQAFEHSSGSFPTIRNVTIHASIALKDLNKALHIDIPKGALGIDLGSVSPKSDHSTTSLSNSDSSARIYLIDVENGVVIGSSHDLGLQISNACFEKVSSPGNITAWWKEWFPSLNCIRNSSPPEDPLLTSLASSLLSFQDNDMHGVNWNTYSDEILGGGFRGWIQNLSIFTSLSSRSLQESDWAPSWKIVYVEPMIIGDKAMSLATESLFLILGFLWISVGAGILLFFSPIARRWNRIALILRALASGVNPDFKLFPGSTLPHRPKEVVRMHILLLRMVYSMRFSFVFTQVSSKRNKSSIR
jgi:hypothetical protein